MLSIIFLGLCLACGLMGVYTLVVTLTEMRSAN
jgi:hypothetical protein